MSIKIRDVSEAAGVSIKTVSRVLNKEKYVAKDTRARVEAAAAKLGAGTGRAPFFSNSAHI